MASTERKVKLLPFEKSRTVKVILSLDDPRCKEYFEYLGFEAAKRGINIKYLLLNMEKVPIPYWILNDRITVMNINVDFTSAKVLSTAADAFCNGGCDLCITLVPKPSFIANELAFRTESSLKVGPDFGGDHPFDIALRYRKKYEGSSMAKEFVHHLQKITRYNPDETLL